MCTIIRKFSGSLVLILAAFTSPAQNKSVEASDAPGKWDYHYYTESGKGGYRSELNYSLSAAELAQFKQRINASVEYLHQNPVTKNPVGFEPTIQASVWTDAYAVNYNTALLKDKIPQAEIILQFCPLYKNLATGKISKGCIEVSHLNMLFNNLKAIASGYENFSGNAGAKEMNSVFQSPLPIKTFAPGITAYENGILVVAKPDKPYWVPVTVGEYFDMALKYWKLDAEKEGNTYVLDFVKKDFAAFSSEDLNKIAYVGPQTNQCMILVTTKPSPKMWMRLNPEYFDKKLPRYAVQLITINTLAEAFLTGQPEYGNGDYGFHFKYTRQLDIAGLKTLLDTP